MALIQSLVDSSKYNIKCPYSMTPIGICVHNTANDASAKNEVSYMKSNNNEVSFHIAIDDVEAIQAIPFNRNAWAAGDGGSGNGNRKYIHVEICYSKSGGSKFTNAEKRAAKEIAALLKQFGWTISNVKKHQDFSGKYCPHRTLDMGWQRFLNMIQDELKGVSTSTSTSTSTSIKVGDKVVVSKNATNYATGQAMASFVKGSTYTVKELKTDRALLQEIVSWVYLKDLTKAGSVSTPVQSQGCDKETKRYSENGRCTIVAPSGIKFRNKPCTHCGTVEGVYNYKESVNYDLVVLTESYVWISWIGASGARRYMPIKSYKTGERWGNCV